MAVGDCCMPSLPTHSVNYFLACYAISLIQGQTIKGEPIRNRTVRNYITDAYKLFDDRKVRDTPATGVNYVNLILTTHANYESVPRRRNMITDDMARWLLADAKCHSHNSLPSAIADWVLLGRYTGFRRSEWCQTRLSVYDTIEEWPGHVAQAFLFRDFTFLDAGERTVPLTPETDIDRIRYVRIVWRWQKNRQNDEKRTFGRNVPDPRFCPVLAAVRIARRAQRLGVAADEPIGVFRSGDDRSGYSFIRDKEVNSYLRRAAANVFDTTDKSYLNMWSTHSIRVTACNLLHREQFPDSYIQERLRWRSNCFRMYLRDTIYAADQHGRIKMTDPIWPASFTPRAPEPHEALVAALHPPAAALA